MYYVKDSHPAIISREDFEKVQKLMAEWAKSKGNIDGNREKYLKRYVLIGTIECSHCGKTYKRHLDNCGTVAESVNTLDSKGEFLITLQFGMPPSDQFGPMEKSAMQEISDIIGGTAVRAFSKFHVMIDIAPPVIFEGSNINGSTLSNIVIKISMTIKDRNKMSMDMYLDLVS